VYVVMPSAKGQAAKTRAFADWIGKRFSPEPPWRLTSPAPSGTG
ncbi:MAG: LysR family transcriptional regulator, partial [Mesorhizobium sp.]